MLALLVLLAFATPTTLLHPPPTELQGFLPSHPFFEAVETNQTAQVGSTVFLVCNVRNLGNKSVTWLRSRDAHIISVDRFVFISDSRFTLLHPTSNTFTLVVKHAQHHDSGRYECQVTTSPKSSLLFNLEVIVPQTRILGEDSDIFLQPGSSLVIKCVIYDALEEPEYVFWYLDSARLLSFDKYSTQTVERLSPDTTLASLTILDVGKGDGGNYTCQPRNLASASVVVHVLANETPAAMQQSKKDLKVPTSSTTQITPSILVIIALLLHHSH